MLVGLALALSRPATAQTPDERAKAAFQDDVHARASLTCEACHGGRASRFGVASASEVYAIRRTAIAPMCARCHSDAAYMGKFIPQLRIDQYAEYVTSTHGKRMAAGEERVATCSDCHGAHGRAVGRTSASETSTGSYHSGRIPARAEANGSAFVPSSQGM